MIGERTGNVFRIGDEITIRVINVNKDERAIDFEIVGMKSNRRPREDRPVKSDRSAAKSSPRKKAEGEWSTRPPKNKKKKKNDKKHFENAPRSKRKKKK